MKQTLLYAITFLLVVSSITAKAYSKYGFKVCNDLNMPIMINDAYEGDIVPQDPHASLLPTQCKNFPWANFSPEKAVRIDSKLNTIKIYTKVDKNTDTFLKGEMCFDIRHFQSGAGTVIGRISKRYLCNGRRISMLSYTIHKSPPLSYGLKFYYYNITIHIKKDVFNPAGNLQKTCDHLQYDSKNHSISAWCHAPVKGHVQKYLYILKNVNNLKALIDLKLWIPSMGFINECTKPHKVNNQQVVDCMAYPESQHKTGVPPGSYTQSCKMLFYDTKHNMIYATCPHEHKAIRLYHDKHYWTVYHHFSGTPPLNKDINSSPKLVYSMSQLDLNKAGLCDDIINDHGVLACITSQKMKSAHQKLKE